MLALRLPPDIEKRLTDLAAKSGRTKSYYAREAILAHLDDMELLAEAERRMRDNPVFIPLDDVIRNLGFNPEDFDKEIDEDWSEQEKNPKRTAA
jgi:RHH-type transcriptional regulator, rel operon repressor / antitoxin RelB